MARKKYLALCLLSGLALPLAACGGGGATTNSTVHNTTVSEGQQLIDLKAALDKGAISQSEYNTKRAQILASP